MDHCLILLIGISLPLDCETEPIQTNRVEVRKNHQPARAEKYHQPAWAEKSEEWWAKVPPDKIGKLAFPEVFKDMREKIPIRTGMTTEEVAKALSNPRNWPLTLRRDRYYLSGSIAKDLPEKPYFIGMDGRMEGFLFVFFKNDRVESVWVQLGRVQLAVGPPFVLWGDPKPRKALKELCITK